MGAEQDYNDLASLCERLGLEDDERENFISSAMGRLGHKMRTMWEDDTEGDKKSGGDFFARGKGSSKRNVSGGNRGGGFGMSGYGS